MQPSHRQILSLEEVQDYPGLLARLEWYGRANPDQVPDFRKALRDALEEPIMAVSREDRFTRFLDEGEIGAALYIARVAWPPEEGIQRSLRERIIRVQSARKQDVDNKKREILGLLLILKETDNPRLSSIKRKVEAFIGSEFLIISRPGRAFQMLEPFQEELESIVEETQEEVRRGISDLEGFQGPFPQDAKIALQKAKGDLTERETLPVAQQMVEIARRAIAGQLSDEDLRILHRGPTGRGRIVQARREFDRYNISRVIDIIPLLSQSNGGPATDSSDFDRTKVLELFQALFPAEGRYATHNIAKRVFGFLGITYNEADYKKSLGCGYPISFQKPRIPAFRGISRFQKGIRLIIPIPADETIIPKLLQDIPIGVFPIFFIPGVVGTKSLRDRYSLAQDCAFFDSVDLFRLAMVPQGKREHAFQQIILPRSPINQLKPYQAGGPVALEMFRGRTDIIEKLKSPKGGTVLFSGRMMGKSSILEKIYSDITSAQGSVPSKKEYCIKISSAGGNMMDLLVTEVAKIQPDRPTGKAMEEDRRYKPTAAMTPAQRRQAAINRLNNLRTMIDRVTVNSRRLTLLIDEADHFAEEDARKTRDESLAWMLRDLEFQNSDKFRVVFAGFQTIHRQVVLENGAFANWFGLVQLGPLDRDDAVSLIREPFEDFGFRFASESGIDRILEFTGRHPLLIQELCSKLMDRCLARRTGRGYEEETTIHAGDVENVCRDDQLKDRIQQVISLNLNQYPRLNLMVYLILDSCVKGQGDLIKLESFNLLKLKEVIVDWYGERFNEYFDEKSIGALITELVSLGLIGKSGDSYDFINKTYASMLMEDKGFYSKLEGLLSEVKNPSNEGIRRYLTLPEESHRIIIGHDGARRHAVIVGLPGMLQGWIVKNIGSNVEISGEIRKWIVLADGEIRSLQELREKLRIRFKETRKTMSTGDMLMKHDVTTLVLGNADLLASGNSLKELIQELSERGIRVLLFGSVPLMERYLNNLFEQDIDLISLKRLRWNDIKEWGEHLPGLTEERPIILDKRVSEDLREVTGGYFPLVSLFSEFCRKNMQSAKEFFPQRGDVNRFKGTLTKESIHEALMRHVPVESVDILREMVLAAIRDKWTRMTLEELSKLALPDIPSDRILAALDLLTQMDLVSEVNEKGEMNYELALETPFLHYFGA